MVSSRQLRERRDHPSLKRPIDYALRFGKWWSQLLLARLGGSILGGLCGVVVLGAVGRLFDGPLTALCSIGVVLCAIGFPTALARRDWRTGILVGPPAMIAFLGAMLVAGRLAPDGYVALVAAAVTGSATFGFVEGWMDGSVATLCAGLVGGALSGYLALVASLYVVEGLDLSEAGDLAILAQMFTGLVVVHVGVGVSLALGRLRFSLRSLLLFQLLVVCGFGIWCRRQSWVLAMRFKASDEMVTSVEFSPDGNRLAAGSWDGNIHIWDALTDECLRVIKGPQRGVGDVAWSADGRSIAAVDFEAARLWDVHTGAELLVIDGHGVQVCSVDFSRDGGRLVTTGLDGTGRVWDVGTGIPLLSFSLGGDADQPLAFFSRDGKRIFVLGADAWAPRIVTAQTGSLLVTLYSRYPTYAAAYSPDGERVVTGHATGDVQLFDASTGQLLMLLGRQEKGITDVAYSPDGGRIAAASFDGTVKVWDASDGTVLTLLEDHAGAVRSISFSPDGKRIATASDDGLVRIWRRRRPEWWWGVFWQREFWATVFFGVLLAWSLRRDRKYFEALEARQAQASS